MHDRIDYVVHSMLASQLSDPSGARGQVVGLLSQPIARQALSGSFGHELGATGAMLAVAVLGFLAFRYPQRHPGRPVVAQFWNAMIGRQAAAQFWNAMIGRQGATQFWNAVIGRQVAARFWTAVIGRQPAAQSWNAMIGRQVAAEFWAAVTGRQAAAQFGNATIGRQVAARFWIEMIGRQAAAQSWNAMSGQQAASQFWNATAGLAEGHAEADLPLHAERVSWLREFIRVPVIGVTQTCHRFTVHAAPACGPV